ncbi:MAG: hypothetical protein AB7P09_11495 [Pyrinomonadaceae bacterium]
MNMRNASLLVLVFLVLHAVAIAQAEPEPDCPAVDVIGPAGITQPGDTMTFTVAPKLKTVTGLGFHWITTSGVIIKGQGTTQIHVQTTTEMHNTSVTATVDISGLATGCRSSASETSFVSFGWHPIVIDEFGKQPAFDLKTRLDTFLTAVADNKGQVGVIILQYPKSSPKGELQRRIRRIEKHIFGLRRFPRERIVIFLKIGEMEYSKLYRIPPGEVEYICPECKMY